jgi:DNA-binding phage protein
MSQGWRRSELKRDLDIDALYAALESSKSERGMSWRMLASELGLPDHTVFTRLSRGQVPDVKTLLSLAGWLGVPLETYAHGEVSRVDGRNISQVSTEMTFRADPLSKLTADKPRFGLSAGYTVSRGPWPAGEYVEFRAPAPKAGFDIDAFYAALESAKSALGMSWRALALELGLADHTVFTRMSRGQVPDVDTLLSLARWLGVRLETYAHDSFVQSNGRERTLDCIRTVLRDDSVLAPENVEALTSVLRATYDELVHHQVAEPQRHAMAPRSSVPMQRIHGGAAWKDRSALQDVRTDSGREFHVLGDTLEIKRHPRDWASSGGVVPRRPPTLKELTLPIPVAERPLPRDRRRELAEELATTRRDISRLALGMHRAIESSAPAEANPSLERSRPERSVERLSPVAPMNDLT